MAAVLKEEDFVEARIARLESDVAHLRSDMTEVRADIRELQHDVSELKASVAGLYGKVDALREEMKRHNAQTRVWMLMIICGFALNFLAHALKWV
jgi:outer membrane murein-binding lipoprotein Lpp